MTKVTIHFKDGNDIEIDIKPSVLDLDFTSGKYIYIRGDTGNYFINFNEVKYIERYESDNL